MNTLLADSAANWNLGATIVLAGVALASQITMWISMKGSQKREVTFAGNPVDRKEFDKHVEENRNDHDKLFSRIGGVERGVEARLVSRIEKSEVEATESRRILHRDVAEIDRKVAGLSAKAETTETAIYNLDAKMDRLIERKNP